MTHDLEELYNKVNEIRSGMDKFHGSLKVIMWVIGALQPLIVGASVWIASSVIELRERQAVIEDRMRIERTSVGNVATVNP